MGRLTETEEFITFTMK